MELWRREVVRVESLGAKVRRGRGGRRSYYSVSLNYKTFVEINKKEISFYSTKPTFHANTVLLLYIRGCLASKFICLSFLSYSVSSPTFLYNRVKEREKGQGDVYAAGRRGSKDREKKYKKTSFPSSHLV
jgi:hypothetical protein